jgi:hypothetical protein
MSRLKAINEKCRECIYDSSCPGTWRQQIAACTSPKCPLFPYRPLSVGHNAKRADSGDSGAKLTPQSSEQLISPIL